MCTLSSLEEALLKVPGVQLCEVLEAGYNVEITVAGNFSYHSVAMCIYENKPLSVHLVGKNGTDIKVQGLVYKVRFNGYQL